jgi:RNA polymerase sigma-70 factor (ECF subfamily)
MNNSQLNELANKIRLGDLNSYKAVFDQMYHPICLNINSIIYDFESSRDISQELFIKLWNKREELPIFSDFKSYIYRVSKNRALNYLESKQVQEAYNSYLKNQTEESYDYLKDQDVKELSDTIESCIQNLPERTRTIFKLNKAELVKQKKIANILGVSLKTVEAHIASAKSEIKKSIKKFNLE